MAIEVNSLKEVREMIKIGEDFFISVMLEDDRDNEKYYLYKIHFQREGNEVVIWVDNWLLYFYCLEEYDGLVVSTTKLLKIVKRILKEINYI